MNWPQLRTILWLRWCLSRNQLRRKGAFGSFVSAIVGLGMIILPICTFAGGLFAGSNGFRDASATFIMGVWVAFTLLFLVL